MDTTEFVNLASCRETWEERFHRIEKTTVNEIGMEKDRCPCRWCCGGGSPILRATINDHFWKHGRDPIQIMPILVRHDCYMSMFAFKFN
jgi:hypothetical protein